ncbi:hypothetical protein C0Q70_04755 [Pomacea canaliculata]|uniref:Uncharacterized protein n=1 Tax=Pomacea canaliculata TaxID=400727 RepID=A0A2T7PJA5_POMCA|nr:uncharacterized protein LOC112559065 [Pomacea canaliculata]PVD33499.1 hypothetical protein C0Q70_04755 [Pomacea canaliculata]
MEQLRETAMKEAVCSGNWTLVKELLCREDVTDREIQESLVLHKLASRTDISLSLVQEIVENACLRHVDLHLTDDNGDTAVMAAARCGNWEIVRLLMSRKAALPDNTDHVIVFLRTLSCSENIRDSYMLTADILRYSWNILKRKTSDGGGRTIRTMLIHLAAKVSCWWLVRDLATADLDLNTLHEDGYGVLHWLARNYIHSDVSLLQKLLDSGADINFPNSHGDTALNVAAKNNNWEMFTSLLLLNANTAICNKEKQTVFPHLSFFDFFNKRAQETF